MSLLKIMLSRGRRKMSDSINIEQKSAFGSETTQIATQNNYYGLTPEQASKMAMGLFYDNFPRLQDEARALVEKRVAEMMDEIAIQLHRKKVTDMSPMSEPDVQYAVYEAQKNYARFATNESLSVLASLVADRIKENHSDLCLKVAIDNAISTVGKLTPEQMDCLSLLFIVHRVKFGEIKTIDQFKSIFEHIANVFSAAEKANWAHLNMMGCLQLTLPDIYSNQVKSYGFSIEEVRAAYPQVIRDLEGDYSVSPSGIMIAITNAEQKTDYRFDPKIWIH